MTSRRVVFVSCVLALVASLPSGAHAAYLPGELLFRLTDSRITESSGVAASARTADVLFTHNDSGDTPRFFAIGPTGDTVATFGLGPLVRQAIDWEDMARGPGSDGGPALFLGDIGDNSRTRPAVIVHEVPEPEVDLSQPGTSRAVPPTTTHVMVYEDGPHDAETLLVHPVTGQILIVTKESSGVSGVYLAVEVHPLLPKILTKVATVDFIALGGGPLTTGGDISPDGTRLTVRTYGEAYEWILAGPNLAASLAATPLTVALPQTIQGEAIGYTHDGTALVTTTEGGGAPVHIMRRAA